MLLLKFYHTCIHIDELTGNTAFSTWIFRNNFSRCLLRKKIDYVLKDLTLIILVCLNVSWSQSMLINAHSVRGQTSQSPSGTAFTEMHGSSKAHRQGLRLRNILTIDVNTVVQLLRFESLPLVGCLILGMIFNSLNLNIFTC